MADAAAEQSAAGLVCPQCGYDLRGINSGRCPECGWRIEAASAAGRLPWSRRGHLGRWRAYAAMLRAVVFRPMLLREELNVPVSLRDARRFSRMTAGLVCVPAFAGVALLYLMNLFGLPYGLLSSPAWGNGPWQKLLLWDAAFPLVTGWLCLPAMIGFVVAACESATRVMPWMVNRRALPMPRRARAVALAHYTSAPLAVWTVCVSIVVGAAGAGYLSNRAVDLTTWIVPAEIAVTLGLAAAMCLTVWRSAGFYRHVCDGGPGRWLAGAVMLMGGWLAAVGFWLVVVPWTLGLIWLLARGQR